MTGASKNTVTKLLVQLGAVCAEYQDRVFHNLTCKRLQADEIWSFCYSKEKNVPAGKRDIFGYGSIWTWTAIDADTKLVPCWMAGPRDLEAAKEFMNDLASRLSTCVQLTTDGLKLYLDAVEGAFGAEIDYAQLIQIYGAERPEEARYSPAVCVGARSETVIGKPDRKHGSTSYVERQNLTMRMHMRRFTRLTNAFSKKLENHIAAISLHSMYYNFVRILSRLHCSPAMAAGVTDRLWDIVVVKLLEAAEGETDQEKTAELWDRWSAQKGPALGFWWWWIWLCAKQVLVVLFNVVRGSRIQRK